MLGLTREELESFVAGLGEPAYRGRQLQHWLHVRRATSFAEMTDLPALLRSRLESCARVGEFELVTAVEAHDGTVKYLFELDDGLRVESVYLPGSPGETVCISSQVGCAMGCHFCATAKMGLFRNLTAAEIVRQVVEVERRSRTRITNVVYMGMGEPLHNYDEVVKSLAVLTDRDGLAITPSKVTVSTVGIVPSVERWIVDLPPAKLAISLHGTTDERRSKLMPVNRAYPLDVLQKSLRRMAHVTRHPITFEYIMIADFNDRREDAANLRHLLRNIPAKVNLIRLHPTGSDLVPSADDAIHRFMGWLVDEGIDCTLRESRGVEKHAACGMLYSDEPFRPSKARAWERQGDV
ncbi:23S rRNA (adenine(2503)-C(2))-methyltransferase RlmN [candidate division KSB1 bacterium]|nr:23S rRNA (adenine(2503)-C(2))-methyltransferase RlmN [candidate division KSB1 bacterium]